MKFGWSWLRLSVIAFVVLNAILVTALAQDMPPLLAPTEPATLALLPPAASAPPPSVPAAPSAQPVAETPSTTPTTPAPPSTPAPVIPPAEGPAQALVNPGLNAAELDQLLAPIALYPDQLLSQILMASTYPLEIVEAARWVSIPSNRSLRGEALTRALQDKNWDPSVKALIPFPDVLRNLCDRLEWTEKLGNAFLVQQADVMDSVQRLRQEAIAAGNLKNGSQCRCVVEQSAGVITIAPASPAVVFVPVYEPALVYGPWPYPLYPPMAFPLPVGFVFSPGFFMGFGIGVDLAYYGPFWGWSRINWGGHAIIVDSARVGLIGGGRVGFAGGVWVHDPAHRLGVAYGNPAVAARFGSTRVSAFVANTRVAAVTPGARVAGFAHTPGVWSRGPGRGFAGNGAGWRGPGMVRGVSGGQRGPGFGAGPAFHAMRGGGPPHVAMGAHGGGGHGGGGHGGR
jgi:hypothetical protein